MPIQIVPKDQQAKGAFNGGEIIENKPIGFNREGGALKAYSNLFYWAYASANVDSTIGLHPHQGFEIMSFVLKGQIRHYDTAGKEWIPLEEGAVQIIRSGKGISHAEFMAKDSVMFQIWFDPGLEKTMAQPATYDDFAKEQFPITKSINMEITSLVGGDAPIKMDSPGVEIERLSILSGKHDLQLDEEKIHSFYLIKGDAMFGNQSAKQDDFIRVNEESKLSFENEEQLDLFHISTPTKLAYSTYAELIR